ncbi:beta-1,6-N-acetylglucosaminyltransferase [Thermomonospora umbrina]|uniref:beta-1,6-N-acetylglucosaminyltransferase n=1 Tax=Thermomonospora umbrina TaxID=111806 RepID=UPI001476D2BE|nr:beta-1,6-N-acetylglucosaminyltransferase [Thermomonospora umbrina]
MAARVASGADTVAVVHHDPEGVPWSAPRSSNILAIPDPRPCRWGRLSLVEAQWRSLEWVTRAIPEFSWALLVSGHDYPIRTMPAIEAELAATRHDAFLRHFPIGDPADDVDPWQAFTRRRYLRRRRLPFSARSVPLPFSRRHPYRDGTGLYVGDMWFNLSAEAVGAILADRPLSDRLLRYLRHAPIPDETFICSMARNVRPALDVADDSKRFIRWSAAQAHPETITSAHLPDLGESDAFFTRKVDMTAHPEVLDALDQLADDRARRGR